MDYNKIGKFIMEERKAKKLTQAKLAEKLFVSEKTISKWENGNGVPDTNSLSKLTEIFNITINELLSGERISTEEYKDKAEKELLLLQKHKEDSDKLMLKLEVLFGVISTISFIAMVLFASYIAKKFGSVIIPTIMIVSAFIIFFVSCFCCLKIEQKVGYYICKKCGHKHIPTFGQVNRAMHVGRTRYMKCPKCQQKSWQKKVVK